MKVEMTKESLGQWQAGHAAVAQIRRDEVRRMTDNDRLRTINLLYEFTRRLRGFETHRNHDNIVRDTWSRLRSDYAASRRA